MELTVISNAPGPNQSQFFEVLGRQAGIELTVYYSARTNAKWRGSEPRELGYRAEFMRNLNPWPDSRAYLHCNPQALPAVARSRGLVLIQGYSYPTALASLWFCAASRLPFIFWGEMINRNPTGKTLPLKRGLVWPALRRAEAVLTMGPRGIASYQAIGVPRSRIHEVPYSCDLRPYLGVPEEMRQNAGRRKKIVVTAQLIRRKRIDIAIQAFLAIAHKEHNWDLVISGDGPCRTDLEKLVPPSMSERVAFLGFVPKGRQADLYADADIFLLPSAEDGWGMVVPEAMAAGLPIVSTTAVESAATLLEDQSAGFLIPPDDVPVTARTLKTLMEDAGLRLRMGRAARDKANSHDATEMGAKCAAILEGVWDDSRRSSSRRGIRLS